MAHVAEEIGRVSGLSHNIGEDIFTVELRAVCLGVLDECEEDDARYIPTGDGVLLSHADDAFPLGFHDDDFVAVAIRGAVALSGSTVATGDDRGRRYFTTGDVCRSSECRTCHRDVEKLLFDTEQSTRAEILQCKAAAVAPRGTTGDAQTMTIEIGPAAVSVGVGTYTAPCNDTGTSKGSTKVRKTRHDEAMREKNEGRKFPPDRSVTEVTSITGTSVTVTKVMVRIVPWGVFACIVKCKGRTKEKECKKK